MNQGRVAAYSAGNKVYGSGRPNPTSGPVDPAGYVERSVNGEATNRRSGLAAAALRRLGSGSGSKLQAPAERRTEQLSQEAVAPPPLHGPPSMYNPIQLADGRQLAPDASGRFRLLGGANGV